MNNFTSMVIAILEHLELLNESEAKQLASKLHESTLPDNYSACSRLLKEIYADIDIKKLSHKVSISKLESEVEDLKTEVRSLKAQKPKKVVDNKK